MLNIFFSPTRRFQSLAQKPEWVVPLILLLILPLIISTIAVTVLPRAVLINAIEERISRTKEFIDQQIEKGRMPQAQREVAIQRIEEAFRTELEFYRNSSKFALFFRFLLRSLSAVIWSGVQLLLWATILNLLLPLLGTGSSFALTFAIAANSALVRLPTALFRALLMLATNKITVATNLALLFPNVPIYLKSIFSCIDIFTIWELILVSVGLKVVFNLQTKQTAPVVFLVWFGYVLLLSGLLTLSGGLAL